MIKRTQRMRNFPLPRITYTPPIRNKIWRKTAAIAGQIRQYPLFGAIT